MKEFEVLLISIDWESHDKFRSVIPSKKYLDASAIQGNHYEYDIVLYHKEDGLFFQFAIKTKNTPVLKDDEGNWSTNDRLFNLHEDLWIIKGKWKVGQRGIGYHYCPSVNTIGKIEIGIIDSLEQIQQTITIDINSHIEDFDFSQLKSDFEGELWNLITSDKSKISSDKIEMRYCDKIFRYPESKSIISFLKAFDRISINPKRELSLSKEVRRIDKVIPITETYRKLSTDSNARFLPSKIVLENYDIYENQYVCFMLHNIHSIILKNKFTLLQVERLQNEVDSIIIKIDKLQDPDPKVDESNLVREIEYQTDVMNKLKEHWKGISDTLSYDAIVNFELIKITIDKHLHAIQQNRRWCYFKKILCLIEFPDSLIDQIEKGEVYILETNCKKLDDFIWNEVNYPVFQLVYVRKIWSNDLQMQINILKKQQENYRILKENDWSQKKILSTQELLRFEEERKNQILTLKSTIQKLNSQIAKLGIFIDEQTILQPEIEKRLRTSFFKKIRWKNNRGFKPSMTFIQNISYRNGLRAYKEILQSEGIEIEVFDLYENVTAYGVREMPQIYELWCFITLLKILENSFHFTHSSKDITKLLRAIDPNRQSIFEHLEINFNGNLAGRRITLHFQKSLENNKRPDFILEISCKGRTINLVLDSKFKNYNYKKSIVFETMDMVKKYSQNGNYVFILHPCKDGIFENRKIRYSNLGGEKIYYGEGKDKTIKFPNHQYGYIELKPNYTDSLKKLIAMGFEYLLERLHTANNYDPKPENEMFCINCGGTKIKIQTHTRVTQRHYYTCSCKNTECNHEIKIDYCWNCRTKLFKHGTYWDYHLESNLNIFDIHCPSCGLSIANMPHL